VDQQLGRGNGHGTDKECGGNLGNTISFEFVSTI
jgi:hypothetical protein